MIATDSTNFPTDKQRYVDLHTTTQTEDPAGLASNPLADCKRQSLTNRNRGD